MSNYDEVEFIAHLLAKEYNLSLNDAEKITLEEWKAANPAQAERISFLLSKNQLPAALKRIEEAEVQIRRKLIDAGVPVGFVEEKAVDATIQFPSFNSDVQPDDISFGNSQRNHKLNFLKTAWFRYAAAIIILFGTGTFFWLRNGKEEDVALSKPVMQHDVLAPVSNRAIITLSDGRKIFVDSVPNGLIAMEGDIRIEKLSDNRIVYSGNANPGTNLFNRFSVPRGSQIATLVLSDGTTVSLNTASTITYPVAFQDADRKTTLSGEAFFEVTSHAKNRFFVTSGSVTTEVLGTHFNVNNYADEETLNVTLLEGRIKVSEGDLQAEIKPGQQATFNHGNISVNEADIQQVVAWKNGLFNFQNMHLPEVMRQIARWYDLQVVYESAIPDIEFFGQMGRNLKLSNVLEVLKSAGINCRIEEGKRLVIL